MTMHPYTGRLLAVRCHLHGSALDGCMLGAAEDVSVKFRESSCGYSSPTFFGPLQPLVALSSTAWCQPLPYFIQHASLVPMHLGQERLDILGQFMLQRAYYAVGPATLRPGVCVSKWYAAASLNTTGTYQQHVVCRPLAPLLPSLQSLGAWARLERGQQPSS